MAAPVALGATAASASPATALAAEASGGGQGAPSGGGGEAAGGGGAAAESAPADSAEAAEQEKTEAKMDGAAPEAAQEDAAVEAQGSPETGGASETAQAAAPPAKAALDETAAGGGGTAASMGESGASEAGEGDGGGGDGFGGGGGAERAAAAEPTAAQPTTETAQPAPDPDAAQRKEDTQQARQEQADNRRVAEGVSDEHAEEQAEQQADSGGAPAGGAAELSSGEKDAGLASLAESPEDGGGEAAPGGAVGGGGGGGGGGGAPVPEPQPAPDTASQDPAAGLAAATALQPLQAGQALQGVSASIDTTAEQEGNALQEQMPPVEVGGDGSGGSAVVAAPEGTAPQATAVAPAAQAQPTPAAEPLPEPGPAPTEAIARPRVADSAEGTVSHEDATRVATSVSSMPTTDPALAASAGPPPQLAKLGDADPTQITSQQSELDATIAAQKARGDADAAAPAGENDVRDRSTRETLQAPRLATPGAGGAGGAAPADDEALGIIAEQKQGGEVRAAMAQAQGAMAAKRSEHQLKVGEEKAKSNTEITALQQENTSQQQAEKGKLQVEVGKARSDWTAEQNAELSSTNNKAKAEIAKGNDKITKEEQQANEKAEVHISTGEAEAAEHKQQAETEAGAKKAEAERQKEDSGGIFSWIAAKVSAFFDALKSAITKVFDAARKLVKAAIDKAKQLAVAVIETARKAVVGLIKAVGAALIALGDVLLAAFPGLKKKWRAFIEAKVKAAENAVNRLADALKQGVTKLLDALGQAFDFLLNAYKKAMLAVLDVAKGVVMGAIKAAKGIADFLGTFVVLIKDIAKAPGQWISNLGAAVMDGVKNHLWKAFKTTVKGWFDSKLEEVLGVGTTIWNVLKQGGISLKQVGQMAFEALKAAIPSALIQLLIEKLVAMIVPAAGAVMAIIEGLQAAWPAVQRVIAAVGLFVVFLKAVKPGGAGPQFATMLAAGAVVVIDFVATWLLKKLRKPAGKLGSKVKAIAQKIIARIKKAMKKVGGWVKGKFKGLKQKFADWKAKRKAKKDAKQKGKEDPDAKKNAKEKQFKKRLKQAMRAIQRALRLGLPEQKAMGKIASIASRHKVSQQTTPSGSSLQVVLTVNPKLESIFPETDSEEFEKAVKAGDTTKTSLQAKLTSDWNDELTRIQNEAKEAGREKGLREAQKEATASMQEKVGTAGGLEEWARTNQKSLERRKDPNKEGKDFEDALIPELEKQAERDGASTSPRKGSTESGLDFASAAGAGPKKGVSAVEIKSGDLKAMGQRSSDNSQRTLSQIRLGEKAGIKLDSSGSDIEGSKAARHLKNHPEDAKKIVEGDVLHEGSRVFENKVSAITTNLLAGLQELNNHLREAIRKATDKNQRAKLLASQRELEIVIAKRGGNLRIRIIQMQGKSRPDTEIEAIKKLLQEVANDLKKVNVTAVLETATKSGKIVKSSKLQLL